MGGEGGFGKSRYYSLYEHQHQALGMGACPFPATSLPTGGPPLPAHFGLFPSQHHQVLSDRLVLNFSPASIGKWSPLLFTSPGPQFSERQLQPREIPSLAQGHTAWWWESQTLAAPAGLYLSGQVSVFLGDCSVLSQPLEYRESASAC